MANLRMISSLLLYLSRIFSALVFLVGGYALTVIILYSSGFDARLPINVSARNEFTIFLPFTRIPFLLGDYTTDYLFSNIVIILFYGLFLWLLGNVFASFRQERLFTQKGVVRLSRFYITNLAVPLLFIFLVFIFGQDFTDIIRIILLHLVIGVFAFFMATIFRQGLLLQEEQDLIF